MSLTVKSPLQAANVGDSSAMVVDVTAGTWSQLTADHRIANSSSERQRLQERGHTVKKRLYGLNISRMLGDRYEQCPSCCGIEFRCSLPLTCFILSCPSPQIP